MPDLTPSELARQLAAHRRERQKRCAREGCSNRFTTKGRGLYCSDTCKELAYRARKKARTADPTP